MYRARIIAFVLLTSVIAACAAAPTSPEQTSARAKSKALRDSTACDSTTLSGYTNPGGHC